MTADPWAFDAGQIMQAQRGAPPFRDVRMFHSVFHVRTPARTAILPGRGQNRVRDSTMNDVTWLPAPGVDGYEVSSDGRVRSLDSIKNYLRLHPTAGLVPVALHLKGRELKAPLNQKGYPLVVIRKKGYTVHQLVCKAFHGPRPTPTHQVRHLNGISTDNRAENLCWGTASENALDKLQHGTHNMARKTHCKRGHPFDDKNTYHSAKGGRGCKQCHRDLNRVWMKNVYKQRHGQQEAS